MSACSTLCRWSHVMRVWYACVRADRVVDDDHLLRVEQLLTDGDRSQCIVHSSTGIAYYVRITLYQSRQTARLQSLTTTTKRAQYTISSLCVCQCELLVPLSGSVRACVVVLWCADGVHAGEDDEAPGWWHGEVGLLVVELGRILRVGLQHATRLVLLSTGHDCSESGRRERRGIREEWRG